MEDIKNLVELPKSLKNEAKYNAFVSNVKTDLDKIPLPKKKELLFEVVLYVASLAEMYYSGRKKGDVKKKLVVECLVGVDTNENIERMIDIALQSERFVKKTWYKLMKKWFKKNVLKKKENTKN